MSKSHETVIDIKATPEEVFRALTEPDQVAKWFAPYVKIEPHVGGRYSVSWDPAKEGNSVVSAFDPYTHFGAYSERSKPYGGEDTGVTRKILVDYYVEALEGGVTRLRLVHSGFGPEAAWDNEMESTKKGWGEFLEKLKEVLEG